MFKFQSLVASGLCFILFSTSCQITNPYRKPPVEVPERWKRDVNDNSPSNWKWNENSACEENEAEEDEPIVQDAPQNASYQPCCSAVGQIEYWWEIFNDPVLNELEAQALESNYSLWAAVERVKQARAIARANYAALFPQVSFDPSFTDSMMLTRNPIPSSASSAAAAAPANQGLSSSGSTSSSSLPTLFRLRQSQYTLPFDFSYEVDLWNRISNTYLSSNYQAQAAYEDYRSVLLALTADIATTYFQLRGLDAQHAVYQKNIRILQEAYDINLSRFEAGLSLYIDVTRAEAQLSLVRADNTDILKQRALQENILALLVGSPASEFSIATNPLNSVPPGVPLVAPFELLARRPDIIRAERLLSSAYANIGVAYAAFFPSLSLTGALGLESPTIGSLFKWKARLWAFAANAMLTVFDAGRNQANLQYAASVYEEAVALYEQQVLIAYKDVEDALANLKFEATQNKELARAVHASQQTVELAAMRYKQGLSNYLEVVDAEWTALDSERSATRVMTNRYIATVLLIKAFGGGWEGDPFSFIDPCQ